MKPKKIDKLVARLTADRVLKGTASKNQVMALREQFNSIFPVNYEKDDSAEEGKGILEQIKEGKTTQYSSSNTDIIEAFSEMVNSIKNDKPRQFTHYTSIEGMDRMDASFKNDEVRLEKYRLLDKQRFDEDRRKLRELVGDLHYEIFERICDRFMFRGQIGWSGGYNISMKLRIDEGEEVMDNEYYESKYVHLYYKNDKYTISYEDGMPYSRAEYLCKDVEPENIEAILDDIKSRTINGYLKLV